MAKTPASPSTPTVKPLAASSVKSKSPPQKMPAEAIQPPIPVASSAPLTKPVAEVQEMAPKDAKAEKKRTGKVAREEGAKPGETREKTKKTKLVRDSFTMPEAEYAVLGDVKKTCLKAGIAVKKSELLRVGVALIRQLDTAKLKEELDRLPVLKAGRPKKSKSA
ncbi:hypothetical protein [Noviherbaspirillum sp. Root189]|uniref:hypothetical protein n=1 Tax=Noviherbaspirillum sp. Root189 TaxID=1736487 RepID=UPI0009E95932|nr:hypothetical protein [Noviherbaspirillum sp. Root189]